jgi:hypothetical protein
MSSKQIHDPKFVPFSLITYIRLIYAHDLLMRQHSYHVSMSCECEHVRLIIVGTKEFFFNIFTMCT